MDESKVVEIVSLRSLSEAEQIVHFLKENNINAFRKGDLMTLYMGNSGRGESVMILEKDKEAAETLLKDFQPADTETFMRRRDLSKGQKIVGWLLLALIILCIIVPVILM